MIFKLFLFALSMVFGFVAIIFYYKIALFLDHTGEDINFLNLRWHSGKHLKKYKEITQECYGKIGIDYYLSHLFSFLAAMLFFVFLILLIIEFP
jgi:hypothetical protein